MGLSLKKIIGGADKLLFGSKGPSNPYQPANIDFLRTPVNAGPAPSFDFLRAPAPDLAGQFRGMGDTYAPGAATRAGAFGDWSGSINAPSSVDQVRSELNNGQLASLLEGIDSDTNKAMGRGVGGYFRRGLIQPGVGVSSDIAATGLASIANAGAKRAADARMSYGLADIERLAGREKAARDAYGTRYTTEAGIGANQGSQQAQILASLLGQTATMGNQKELSYADILAGNFNAAADRQNSRDLAFATGSSNLYNEGANRRETRRQGLWDRTSIGIGFKG
jgi:hypothetical protein